MNLPYVVKGSPVILIIYGGAFYCNHHCVPGAPYPIFFTSYSSTHETVSYIFDTLINPIAFVTIRLRSIKAGTSINTTSFYVFIDGNIKGTFPSVISVDASNIMLYFLNL